MQNKAKRIYMNTVTKKNKETYSLSTDHVTNSLIKSVNLKENEISIKSQTQISSYSMCYEMN